MTWVDAAPTARPRTKRAAISICTSTESAAIAAPTVNRIPAVISRRRCPKRSTSRPDTTAPMAAPASRMLTTRPTWVGERPMSGRMNSMAPAMTPVS